MDNSKILLNEYLKNENAFLFSADLSNDSSLSRHLQKLNTHRFTIRPFKALKENDFFTEWVSSVDKGNIRHQIREHLITHSEQKNIPYAYISHTPRHCSSVFTFRVDSDGYTKESFYKTAALAKKYTIPMTWFIDVFAHRNAIDELYYLHSIDQEIQPHCYYHFPHLTYKNSLEDYQKAIDFFSFIGLNSNACAAPYGLFNKNLDRVYNQLGINYSSDFSYSYDDIPSYPIFNSTVSKTLQVPIHPICIGTMKQAEYKSENMITYFKEIIDYKRITGEPIHLYGHPVDRLENHLEVFDEIFSYVQKDPQIKIYSMGEYVQWWKKRRNVTYSITQDNNSFTISTENNETSVELTLHYNGKIIKTPLINSKVLIEDMLPYTVKPPYRFTLSKPSLKTTSKVLNRIVRGYGKILKGISSKNLHLYNNDETK